MEALTERAQARKINPSRSALQTAARARDKAKITAFCFLFGAAPCWKDLSGPFIWLNYDQVGMAGLSHGRIFFFPVSCFLTPCARHRSGMPLGRTCKRLRNDPPSCDVGAMQQLFPVSRQYLERKSNGTLVGDHCWLLRSTWSWLGSPQYPPPRVTLQPEISQLWPPITGGGR